MSHKNLKFKSLLHNTNVIPVIVIDRIEDALPKANSLVNQGYNVLEVTLRTECALEAATVIIDSIPDIIVGLGTIVNSTQLEQAYKAGAKFAVSPGSTDELIKAAEEIPVPLLPGISTASEVMKLKAIGYQYLKLFPAQAVGGMELIKSLQGPFPSLQFCPTGGITEELAVEYLKLTNVISVGGSWMTNN